MPAAAAAVNASTIGPSGGFYNNGWGNGYQLPPGDSGPNNNAANTLPASKGGRNPNDGVNNGMVSASANSGSINNPDGTRLTPLDPYSPTPSRDSNSGFYTTDSTQNQVGDTLVIGYSGDVKGLNSFDWVDPAFEDPTLNREITFGGAVSLSDIRTASGDDKVQFSSSVSNTNIALGEGSDEVVFGGLIQNTTLDLGGADGAEDTVRINSESDIKGLRITGAEDDDVLFIGSSQYSYDSSSNAWISTTDPNDKRTF